MKPVLASAAVPPLLPPVKIDGALYWDGLFAHNPPIRDLVDRRWSMRPQQIWVIQIDPESCERVPTTVLGTVDRRFELSSNLSLNAELHWVRQINQWVDEKVLSDRDFKIINVARLEMGEPLASRLDVASKVDRDPAYLDELRAAGQACAASFMAQRHDAESRYWLPKFPHRYAPRSMSTASAAGS